MAHLLLPRGLDHPRPAFSQLVLYARRPAERGVNKVSVKVVVEAKEVHSFLRHGEGPEVNQQALEELRIEC